MNHVNLVGRLTRDPELRHTGGGTPVANLRLAFTSRTKVGESWEDVPNYVDVTVFGRQAESVTTYMAKGRRIGVDGRLSWREWESTDGTKRQTIEVVANDVYFLDSREDGDAPKGKAKDDLGGDASPAPAAKADDTVPF